MFVVYYKLFTAYPALPLLSCEPFVHPLILKQNRISPVSDQTQFSRDELELCGFGELFKSSAAQLPTGPLLMMDRIVDIKPHAGLFNKGEIIAEFEINPECWFFEHHFAGAPLMPGSLMLEGMWQTLGFYLGWSGYPGKVRALGVGDLKLKSEIPPDAGKIQYKINIRRIVARQTILAIAQASIYQGEREIASAKDLRAGLFQG
jgi:3-hydroxyacyl-[acyl-carrier protein] dehydratase/trans-2-decenoyl-[acyl-carrier protein] isomerase